MTVSLSPLGNFVAAADNAGGLSLYKTDGSSQLIRFKAQGHPVSFAWSSDETRLLVSGANTAVVFDTRTLHRQSVFASSMPFQTPQLSPDGRWISSTRGGNLWLASSTARTFTPVTHDESGNVLSGVPDPIFAREFDVSTHLQWAPDSTSLAYLETIFSSSNHNPLPGAPLPQLRLNIVSLPSLRIQPIFDSSADWPYLLRPVWLPDSQRLAFYRLNRLQNQAQLCIWENGAIRTIFTDRDDYWINPPDAPVFTPDGENVIVTSERSGHRQLYVYSLAGDLLRALTPPAYEVSRLLPTTLANRFVYFLGAAGTLQEQHLFRVSLENAALEQISQQTGWHTPMLSQSGDTRLDRFSSAQQPERISWYRGASLLRTIQPPGPAGSSVPNEYLPIKTHDGILLPARLYKPADFDARRKYPVLLYTFSGPRGRVVADRWDGWQMAWNRYMVGQGYLVLTVDVRGSGGYAHWFEEYIHYRFGAQETVDLREVVSYLRAQPFIDPRRIGIWGSDYGAHTVVHAMLEFPQGFKAGFADAPIADWRKHTAYFTERYLGLPLRHISEYDDSSALEHVKRMTGDLLVCALDGDPHRQALENAMHQAKAASVAPHFHIFTPQPTYRENPAELAELLNAMTDFFGAHL